MAGGAIDPFNFLDSYFDGCFPALNFREKSI